MNLDELIAKTELKKEPFEVIEILKKIKKEAEKLGIKTTYPELIGKYIKKHQIRDKSLIQSLLRYAGSADRAEEFEFDKLPKTVDPLGIIGILRRRRETLRKKITGEEFSYGYLVNAYSIAQNIRDKNLIQSLQWYASSADRAEENMRFIIESSIKSLEKLHYLVNGVLGESTSGTAIYGIINEISNKLKISKYTAERIAEVARVLYLNRFFELRFVEKDIPEFIKWYNNQYKTNIPAE